jgi:hypothetical protein
MQPLLTSELAAGQSFSVVRSRISDGFVVRDSAQAAAAFLSDDASYCAVRDRRLELQLQRDHFAWMLALVEDGPGRQVAISRPKLRPGAYRITDRSNRRLRLMRLPLSNRWTLASDRGVIARLTFEPLFAQQRVTFIEGEEHLPVGEITMGDARIPLANRAAIVLLAIATVHADLRLPAVAPGA